LRVSGTVDRPSKAKASASSSLRPVRVDRAPPS
jgi:hypothetical protein